MKEIIIATKNQGKAKEFIELFEPYGLSVKTLLDYPDALDIEETGQTFAENAILKAQGIADYFQKTVLADDSGLCVDALDGKPGVYSARYAGDEKNDDANIDKVLEELAGVPFEKRTAHFQCSLAIARPNQEPVLFEGFCHGIILTERRGTGGFGYDPIFYVPEMEKTMAEMTSVEKNKISHRGAALKKLAAWLKDVTVRGELKL